MSVCIKLYTFVSIKPKLITQLSIRKLSLFFLAGFIFQAKSFAQKDSSAFNIGGYVDAYYAVYTDSVGTNNYQKFPVISPRSNVFGLNIIQFTGQYNSKKLRAAATLHYGDIPSATWSPVFNLIQEANFGIRLGKNAWIDAGFFKTHIGTEALLPKDNITSSFSMITFYEPLFQAGIKFSYAPGSKLSLSFHLLNGYNTFVENNKKKTVGLGITYLLGKAGSVGYYNLLGDETADSIVSSHVRFLNNLVFNYQLTKKLKVILGGDAIFQQHSAIADANKAAFIYGGIATFKYGFTDKFGAYARGDIFSDKDGFLTGIISNTNNKLTGYQSWAITGGLEYKPAENAYIRLEGKQLQMDKNQKIFYRDGSQRSVRFELMLHGGIYF